MHKGRGEKDARRCATFIAEDSKALHTAPAIFAQFLHVPVIDYWIPGKCAESEDLTGCARYFA